MPLSCTRLGLHPGLHLLHSVMALGSIKLVLPALPWAAACLNMSFIPDQFIFCCQASLEACRCMVAPVLSLASPVCVLEWPLG